MAAEQAERGVGDEPDRAQRCACAATAREALVASSSPAMIALQDRRLGPSQTRDPEKNSTAIAARKELAPPRAKERPEDLVPDLPPGMARQGLHRLRGDGLLDDALFLEEGSS